MSFITVQRIYSWRPLSNHVGKWSRWFVLSVGGVFILTGLAKVLSAFGNSQVLNQDDPIFKISFRQLMFIVGWIELIIAVICILNKNAKLSLCIIAWLSTNFMGYRMGLFYIGYHEPCSCLGSLTGVIHVPSEIAYSTMKYILAYLIFGSYTLLLLNLKQFNNSIAPLHIA